MNEAATERTFADPQILSRIRGGARARCGQAWFSIFGLRDRCLHRCVALSRKLQCFTKRTMSCWYHGFIASRLNRGVRLPEHIAQMAGWNRYAIINRRHRNTACPAPRLR